jgi:hypothetical protein
MLRSVRSTRWAAGLGAVGLTAAFSVAAAHAFKGHSGHAQTAQADPQPQSARPRVTVPGPDQVPGISADGSLQPPEQAPQAAPQDQQQQAPQQQQVPQEQQQPPVSGGS